MNWSRSQQDPIAVVIGRLPGQVSPTRKDRYTKSSKLRTWLYLPSTCCVRPFAGIISLPSAKPVLPSPFYQRGNWGSERLMTSSREQLDSKTWTLVTEIPTHGKSQGPAEIGLCSSQPQDQSPIQEDPGMVERPWAQNNRISTTLCSLLTPSMSHTATLGLSFHFCKMRREFSSQKMGLWTEMMLWKPWSITLNEKHCLWLLSWRFQNINLRYTLLFPRHYLFRKLKVPNN